MLDILGTQILQDGRHIRYHDVPLLAKSFILSTEPKEWGIQIKNLSAGEEVTDKSLKCIVLRGRVTRDGVDLEVIRRIGEMVAKDNDLTMWFIRTITRV